MSTSRTRSGEQASGSEGTGPPEPPDTARAPPGAAGSPPASFPEMTLPASGQAIVANHQLSGGPAPRRSQMPHVPGFILSFQRTSLPARRW